VIHRVWLLTAAVAAAASGPALPPWNEADRKALEKGEFIPGLLLLGEDPVLEGSSDPSVPPPTAQDLAEKESASPEVPESFLDDYFGSRPESFLIDPQELLGSKERRDRESFLKYHSGDSKVDLFVYLFDGHQAIPAEVREEEIVERFHSEGKPAVVVYYYLGAPQKSDIYVSPVLSEAVPAAEQRRALSSSVEEALEKPDALDQLEAFCVQLSIRVYWMEKAAGLVREPQVTPLARLRAKKEVAEPAPEMWDQLRPWLARYGSATGVMAGALLTVAAAGWYLRHRARYRFPVFDVPPRLGGAHAAGVGAVISFGSTTQSPSSQKNDVPDYLGL
jgi:hypothetical protein